MLNFLVITFNYAYKWSISVFCLFISIFLFIISISFYGFFDRNYSSYQFLYLKHFSLTNSLQYCIGFGIDGLSLAFIWLTTLLFVLIFLTGWKYNLLYLTEYCYCLISLEFFLLAVFSAIDLLTFFFMFESVLLPMFLIIGLWGSLNRKVYASFLFFLYTLAGSLCLLFVILILYYDFGTLSFALLSKIEISNHKQLILWILTFFLSQ